MLTKAPALTECHDKDTFGILYNQGGHTLWAAVYTLVAQATRRCEWQVPFLATFHTLRCIRSRSGRSCAQKDLRYISMYPFSFEALVCPQRPLTHLCVLFSFRAFVRPERPVIHLYVVVLFRCEAFVCPQKRLRHLLVLFSCRILVPPERPVIHLVCTRIGSCLLYTSPSPRD